MEINTYKNKQITHSRLTVFFEILSYGLATIIFNVASLEPIIATNFRLPRSASLSVFIFLYLELLEEKKKICVLFVFKSHIHKPNQLFFRKMCKPVFLVEK